MTGMKRKLVLGAGLLGLLGAAVAQGMMDDKMTGGVMMRTYVASSRLISQDEALDVSSRFAARYGQEAKIRNFMAFTENYHLQIVNGKTGIGLGELPFECYTTVVQTEYRPNMVWNTPYSMDGEGFGAKSWLL